jgi:hypothetical protein
MERLAGRCVLLLLQGISLWLMAASRLALEQPPLAPTETLVLLPLQLLVIKAMLT